MKNDELLNSELKAIEVLDFILKQYDQEKYRQKFRGLFRVGYYM